MSTVPSPQPPRRYFWPLAMIFLFVLAIAASAISVWRSGAHLRSYPARGIIREMDLFQKTITIQHDAIPGFMPAMTMPFVYTDVRELAGITNGDTISFRITVSAKDGWIDHIRKIAPEADTVVVTNAAQLTNGSFRLVRDVDPLNVGDPCPITLSPTSWASRCGWRTFMVRRWPLLLFLRGAPTPRFVRACPCSFTTPSRNWPMTRPRPPTSI